MRIQDKLLGHSRIENDVTERNDRGIDDLGDWQAIMQDSLHQLPVVFQYRGFDLERNQFWLCGCRRELNGESEVLESIDQAQNVLAFSALVEVGSA
jgi:hypothetical protein